MRWNVFLVLIGLAALLSTSSLLGGLRHALARREKAESEVDPREAERRRIREALGDAVGSIDLSLWPEHLRPKPGQPDRDTLRRSMPRSERPAWHDIREDRDAGY
jgi:hypothetical protein